MTEATTVEHGPVGDQVASLIVDFCGELYPVQPGESLTVGRDADLVVDEDNAYLHRKLIEFRHEQGFWWLLNVGSRLSVTISGEAGTLQSWVAPGSRIPIVLPLTTVLFTAGETTYELDVTCTVPTFQSRDDRFSEGPGDETLGTVDLTAAQFKLILALAENTLRRTGSGLADLPSNANAAKRLGWTMPAFNRQLDNVCAKFTRAGVKGLHAGAGRLATNRRARLVEYAVGARVVRPEHLPLLDQKETR